MVGGSDQNPEAPDSDETREAGGACSPILAVVKPRAPGPGERIENTLANPARLMHFFLGLRLGAGVIGRPIRDPESGKVVTYPPDKFLVQLLQMLRHAERLLKQGLGGRPALEARVEATVKVHDLLEWATRSMVLRSGGDTANPLVVTQQVADSATELARLGRKIRIFAAEETAAPRGEGNVNQQPREPAPATAEVVAPAGMLSAADLAAMHGVPPEPLRKRLERFRRQHLDGGWHEVTDRRPREPKYLYDPRAVEPILSGLKSS